jgi:fatty-acyl-CoA synthase
MALERSVFGVLDRSAGSWFGDEPAFGFEGKSVTFVELRDRSLEVARGLQARGVVPGDRVAVMMGNRLEWLEVFFGIAAVGAVCVPVNVLLTGPEIEHVCADSGASVLVLDEIGTRAMGTVDHRFELVVTVGSVTLPDGATGCAYDELRRGGDGQELPVGPDLDDTLVLYYSSGTTGLPKAAEHTHDGVLWNAAGQIQGLGLTRAVRYAIIPSFSWAAGLHNLTLALVWLGGFSQIRRTGGATVEEIVGMLEADRITHVMLVPSLLRELAARPDLMDRLEAGPLEWIVTGAEPVPRVVVDECVSGMPSVAVCQGYGLSEFPTIATVLAPEEVATHDGSAGRPLPHTTAAVRAEDGGIRRSGRGELLLRSLATMRGYHGRPEQTAEAFRDGWLHTGDLVEIDDEGFVTIVGRTKDMIISGGLNVYPKEIEDVVALVPGVREVAVVAVPDERFGETPVAVVVAEDGFDVAEVDRVCRERLAGYKRPRHVLLRTEPLPRSANAKLLKRELRPWAAAVVLGAPAEGAPPAT